MDKKKTKRKNNESKIMNEFKKKEKRKMMMMIMEGWKVGIILLHGSEGQGIWEWWGKCR